MREREAAGRRRRAWHARRIEGKCGRLARGRASRGPRAASARDKHQMKISEKELALNGLKGEELRAP